MFNCSVIQGVTEEIPQHLPFGGKTAKNYCDILQLEAPVTKYPFLVQRIFHTEHLAYNALFFFFFGGKEWEDNRALNVQ